MKLQWFMQLDIVELDIEIVPETYDLSPDTFEGEGTLLMIVLEIET